MKAIAIKPGKAGVFMTDRPEPTIVNDDEVKIRVLEVGICGTDREEIAGGRAQAPAGSDELVIGHEMLGQIVAVGTAVQKVKPGDYGAFIVRRGCGHCMACINGRSDMCFTGNYTERGIKGADGYQAAFVVDREQYLVPIHESVADISVLTEPMSVAAKAIDEAMILQSVRLRDFEDPQNWLKGKKALVAGIGPIGILAAFALRLKGAEVYGLDIVPPGSTRPQVLESIGGKYIDGRSVGVTDIDDKIAAMDFVFEATGMAKLQLQLIDTLAVNGIYVATGIPGGERPLSVNAGTLMQQLVLKNQIVIGSVNASIHHYGQAVDYLRRSKEKWPDAIARVITHRAPYTEFKSLLQQHNADEIKAVLSWR